jgi:hypothetical protein
LRGEKGNPRRDCAILLQIVANGDLTPPKARALLAKRSSPPYAARLCVVFEAVSF